MIVLKLLHLEPFFGISETVEIAKGKYELATSIKKGLKKIKRQKYENRGC